MKTPNLDELTRLSGRLRVLLGDPEPGLTTWRDALNNVLRDIAEFAPPKPAIQYFEGTAELPHDSGLGTDVCDHRRLVPKG